MHHITLEKEHHNGHRNEETQGFDHCVPVMVHAESTEEAKEIAQVVSEQFGGAESDNE